jgi:UDP-2,4-diacetamido-2,4,6-trideoxy-beta-L-altropyranose hydrolase
MIGPGAGPEEPTVRLRVAIRADASLRIGAGHVMRCLALAQTLRSRGHDVVFVMREGDGDLREVVANSHAFRVLPLRATPAAPPGATDELADASQTLDVLDELHVDWVVADHYALGARWEAHIAATGPRVLAIDDYASRHHACTLLVDHNLVQPSVYAERTVPDTGLLLGPRYALLRPEFTQVGSEPTTPEVPQTIIVSFGGSDPTRQTTKALHAIRNAHHAPGHVIAIAGHHHPDLDQLRTMATEWPALEVHTFVDDPASFLRRADLAIGAGGISALERIATGVPSIVLTTADNQDLPAAALSVEGALLYLGPASTAATDGLTAAIDAMANRYLRAAMRRRGRTLLDGQGPGRIVRAMLQRTPVTIRAATTDDRQRVYWWRNHPAIRAAAIDASEISWETHDRWFDVVLRDPDRHLLVAEHRDTPIGVIRYDLDRTTAVAELSIFLAPGALGLGLGHPVLDAANAWLTTNEPEVRRIRAHVLGSNTRSLKLFESAGFRTQRTTLEIEQTSSEAATRAKTDDGRT